MWCIVHLPIWGQIKFLLLLLHSGKCIWYIGCQGPSVPEEKAAVSGPHSAGEDGSSRFGINPKAPIFITPARRIDKFRGQTTTPGDTATVYEWVADARSLLLARQIPLRGQAGVVLENLTGKDRQEIIGRGDEVMDFAGKARQEIIGRGDEIMDLARKARQEIIGRGDEVMDFAGKARQEIIGCGDEIMDFAGKARQEIIGRGDEIMDLARKARQEIIGRGDEVMDLARKARQEIIGRGDEVMDLARKARQEIIGRGDEVMGDPEQIFQIMLRVFGDGDTLSQLQQRFFSYRQDTYEDLESCSLKLL